MKEIHRARHTHELETADGGTCKDTERGQLSKAHSRPRDDRARDLSGHGKKPAEKGTFTNWRRQREGLVRTQRETVRAGCTHVLETAEVETSQDMERNRLSEAHSLSGDGRLVRAEINRPSKAYSLPGDGRGMDLSGQGKNLMKRGALTSWRWQREGHVRTRKGTD